MKSKGTIEEHLMFKKSYGEGSGVGINVGEYLEGKVTIGSAKTEDGCVCAFAAEGEFTDDAIEYCLPLIQGEQNIHMRNGLPIQFILKKSLH